MSEQAPSETAMRNVRLSGKIVHGDRTGIFDCVVRALSPTQAVIEMPSTLGVPKAFHLRIKPSSDEHECELEWRTEKQIGVTFGFTQTQHGPAAGPQTTMPRKLPSARRVWLSTGIDRFR